MASSMRLSNLSCSSARADPNEMTTHIKSTRIVILKFMSGHLHLFIFQVKVKDVPMKKKLMPTVYEADIFKKKEIVTNRL
jgi:hypothetical protein